MLCYHFVMATFKAKVLCLDSCLKAKYLGQIHDGFITKTTLPRPSILSIASDIM